jgi:hypothetical protein
VLREPRVAQLTALFLLIQLVGPVSATTVIDFNLTDLVRFADVCARVRVDDAVDLDANRTTYSLHTIDVLFGAPPTPWSLTLDNAIIGTPTLKVGGEYLLFIHLSPATLEPIVGFGWATYEIREEALFHINGRPVAVTGSVLSKGEATTSGPPQSYEDFSRKVASEWSRLKATGIPMRSLGTLRRPGEAHR